MIRSPEEILAWCQTEKTRIRKEIREATYPQMGERLMLARHRGKPDLLLEQAYAQRVARYHATIDPARLEPVLALQDLALAAQREAEDPDALA